MDPLKLPSLDYILHWESFEKFYRVAHMARVEVMISLANSISNTVFLLARFDVVESFREGVKKIYLLKK